MDYIEAYDVWKYKKSLMMTLVLFKHQISQETIVMVIKNIVAIHGFKVENPTYMKQLVFFYFYVCGSVDFTNGYSLKIHKEKITVNIDFFAKKKYEWYQDFQQYFDFWKNEIFLNRIVDSTVKTYTEADKNIWKLEAKTLFDFFILFLHENFELYSLEGEYFPLFKWLINELAEGEDNH